MNGWHIPPSICMAVYETCQLIGLYIGTSAQDILWWKILDHNTEKRLLVHDGISRFIVRRRISVVNMCIFLVWPGCLSVALDHDPRGAGGHNIHGHDSTVVVGEVCTVRQSVGLITWHPLAGQFCSDFSEQKPKGSKRSKFKVDCPLFMG